MAKQEEVYVVTTYHDGEKEVRGPLPRWAAEWCAGLAERHQARKPWSVKSVEMVSGWVKTDTTPRHGD